MSVRASNGLLTLNGWPFRASPFLTKMNIPMLLLLQGWAAKQKIKPKDLFGLCVPQKENTCTPSKLHQIKLLHKTLYLQGVLHRSVILWKPIMPTKTIHGVKNVICTCSLEMDISFFTFRMNFELRG